MKQMIAWVSMVTCISILFSGCTVQGALSETEQSFAPENFSSNALDATQGQEKNPSQPTQQNNIDGVTIVDELDLPSLSADDVFSDKDYSTDVLYALTEIVLSDTGCVMTGEGAVIQENTITITQEGSYRLSGTVSEVQVVVDAAEDKVQLLLDGVQMQNSTTAPIYIQQADKVFVTTVEGSENSLIATFTADENAAEKIDAAIYAKDDVTLNGMGSLTIQSTEEHGIVAKDDLSITSGVYTVDCAGKALDANDSLDIAGGTFYLTSGDDAVHSDMSVAIYGGAFTIQAGDDAITADTYTTIAGGNIEVVTCYEGIEGQIVRLSGGSVTMLTNDDGINARMGSNGVSGIGIYITGGSLVMDTNGEGDGLDSNGDIEISGGEVRISSTTITTDTSLDYNNNGTITGGTFLATGSEGRTTQNFDAASTQGSIFISMAQTQTGDVTLTDSNGDVVVSFSPAKQYQTITMSTPEIVVGETYTLTAGSYTETIVMETLLYGEGNESSMGGMFGGNHMQNNTLNTMPNQMQNRK